MKVILDTNVYVSLALRSQALEPLSRAWQAGQFSAYISSYLLAEVKDVLSREKFRPFLTLEEVSRFLALLRSLCEPLLVNPPHPYFSDPKDRYLLAMLEHSDAELLVTGDKRLLELGTFGDKAILTPIQFVKRLGT